MKANIFFDAKTRRRKKTQSIFLFFFASVGMLVPQWLRVKLVCLVSLLIFVGIQPVFAQTATPQVGSVIVSVLDADGQPVPGIRVELVLFQYATGVEPFPAGGCVTDATGTCVIWTDLPPSSGADWYEGVVYVSDLGRQLVGWQGDETLIVIQLDPDGMIATEEPHLHGPYTGEQYAPTEGSPASSQTVTQTASPIVIPSFTATTTPTLTPTLIPSPSPDVPESTFPIGWVIVGVLVFGGALWWVLTRRIKRHG